MLKCNRCDIEYVGDCGLCENCLEEWRQSGICTKCKCDPQDYPFPKLITFNAEGVCSYCVEEIKYQERIKEKL